MEEEKGFFSIASNNIRDFTNKLNEAKITKDDIVKVIYKPNNNEYVAIIYN